MSVTLQNVLYVVHKKWGFINPWCDRCLYFLWGYDRVSGQKRNLEWILTASLRVTSADWQLLWCHLFLWGKDRSRQLICIPSLSRAFSLSRPPSAPSVFRFSHLLVYGNFHWSSLSLSLFFSVFLSALWVSFEFLPFFFLWKHNNALCRGCNTRYYNICFFNLVKWTDITLFSTVQIMLEAKERGNWFCLRAKIIIKLPFLLNDWHEIKEMDCISLISCHLVALFPSFDLKQCSFVRNDTDTSTKRICFMHSKLLLWWV